MTTSMTRMIAVATTALALTAVPQIASAGECGSGARVASEIWTEFGEEAKKLGCKDNQECLDKRNKREAMGKRLIGFWNKMAGNGWARIGPRQLRDGARHDGKVVSVTHRVFVTPAPVEGDKMTLSIQRVGGKGPAVVTVCRADENGASKLKRVTFRAGDKKKTIRVSGVDDKLVIVKLQGKKVGKSFRYTMRAK